MAVIGTLFSGPGHGRDGAERPWTLPDDVAVAGRRDEIARDEQGSLRVEAEHPIHVGGRTVYVDRVIHFKDGHIEAREIFTGQRQASHKVDQLIDRYVRELETQFPDTDISAVLHSTSSFDDRLSRDADRVDVRVVHAKPS